MTAIDRTFTSTLRKKPGKGGWTYAMTTDPAEYSGPRDLARVRSRIDGLPFRGSFMALGDGTRKLAVRTDVRAQIGQEASGGTVHLEEHIPLTPRRSAP